MLTGSVPISNKGTAADLSNTARCSVEHSSLLLVIRVRVFGNHCCALITPYHKAQPQTWSKYAKRSTGGKHSTDVGQAPVNHRPETYSFSLSDVEQN